MNPMREIIRNASITRSLTRRYSWTTVCVGLLGVAVGIAFMLLIAKGLSTVLDVSESASLKSQPNGTFWLVSFLACIPISIYLGCATIAGIFATVMVWLGKLSPSEALYYALLSRYPASWRRR
ncbi:MAG: hypothetical protein AAB393_02805 [Bacteroidota bacterium]